MERRWPPWRALKTEAMVFHTRRDEVTLQQQKGVAHMRFSHKLKEGQQRNLLQGHVDKHDGPVTLDKAQRHTMHRKGKQRFLKAIVDQALEEEKTAMECQKIQSAVGLSRAMIRVS